MANKLDASEEMELKRYLYFLHREIEDHKNDTEICPYVQMIIDAIKEVFNVTFDAARDTKLWATEEPGLNRPVKCKTKPNIPEEAEETLQEAEDSPVYEEEDENIADDIAPGPSTAPDKGGVLFKDAEFYNRKGNEFCFKGQHQEAIEQYSNAIELNSNEALYFYNRGMTYLSLSEYIKCMEDCIEATKLDENYSKPYACMGKVYFLMNEFKRAAKMYTLALRLEPENFGYRKNYKLVQEKLYEQYMTEQRDSNLCLKDSGATTSGTKVEDPQIKKTTDSKNPVGSKKPVALKKPGNQPKFKSKSDQEYRGKWQ